MDTARQPQATAGILRCMMPLPPRPPPSGPRFLQLADVAEILNISSAQVYALVRCGDLPAIKIGGRGQWRVEASRAGGLHRADVRPDPRLRDHPPVRPSPTARTTADDGRRRTRGLSRPVARSGPPLRTRASAANGTVRTAPDLAPAARLTASVLAHLDEVRPTRSTVPLTTLASISQTWTGSRSRAIPRSADPSPSRGNT